VLDGARFNATIYEWMVMGGLKMEVGFLVDGLTAMMMVVVTFVSLMVHVYTIGYMAGDPGYQRFFAYISLFTFSMLMLVMSNNFLQLFFGWEAVGLVSYLLIGFWFKKPDGGVRQHEGLPRQPRRRLRLHPRHRPDRGLCRHAELRRGLRQGAELAIAIPFPGTDWMLLTVACICLFIGAMGKSAQFPLHVWLPDSMEGPTPISALIHAATMVTAGIFMVARMSPLFELSDTALNFVLVIGAITALFMGFLGIIQNDIKRVVAYSTLSQLGYMTVALGASAYSRGGVPPDDARLLQGAAVPGRRQRDHRHAPRPGHPQHGRPAQVHAHHLDHLAAGLAGADRHAAVLGLLLQGQHHPGGAFQQLPGAGFAYFAVLAGVFVTAFYSFRMYFLVFHGEERFRPQALPARRRPRARRSRPRPPRRRRTSRPGWSRCRWCCWRFRRW
jgi:NADH-quinone oxidoreductase subunit L